MEIRIHMPYTSLIFMQEGYTMLKIMLKNKKKTHKKNAITPHSA